MSSFSSFSKILAGFQLLTGFKLLFNNSNNDNTLSLEDCTSALIMGTIIEFLLSKEHANISGGIVLSIESAIEIATTTKIANEFQNSINITGLTNDAKYKAAMKKQQSSLQWIRESKLYRHSIKENTYFLKILFDDENLSKFLSIQNNILFIGKYKFTEVNFVLTKENKLKLFVTNSNGLVEINF